jgi:hypothetical protein
LGSSDDEFIFGAAEFGGGATATSYEDSATSSRHRASSRVASELFPRGPTSLRRKGKRPAQTSIEGSGYGGYNEGEPRVDLNSYEPAEEWSGGRDGVGDGANIYVGSSASDGDGDGRYSDGAARDNQVSELAAVVAAGSLLPSTPTIPLSQRPDVGSLPGLRKSYASALVDVGRSHWEALRFAFGNPRFQAAPLTFVVCEF